MPTPKQMEKLAAEAARRPAPPAAAPDAPLPAEYWESVLKDPRAEATGAQMRQRRLSEIQRHVLRVCCRRCERIVEIQTADVCSPIVWRQRDLEGRRAAAARQHLPAAHRQA
ncbi:hypothetical protein ACVWZZ_006596 [Bradyrhizobium sp. LM6.10]